MNRLFCFCIAVLIVACPALIGRTEDAVASIMGRVKLNGRPLVEGKLLAKRADDKKALDAPIKTGLYSAAKVAPGKYVVAIEGTGVPAKYSTLDTSALTVEIKEGANTLDFDLVGD